MTHTQQVQILRADQKVSQHLTRQQMTNRGGWDGVEQNNHPRKSTAKNNTQQQSANTSRHEQQNKRHNTIVHEHHVQQVVGAGRSCQQQRAKHGWSIDRCACHSQLTASGSGGGRTINWVGLAWFIPVTHCDDPNWFFLLCNTRTTPCFLCVWLIDLASPPKKTKHQTHKKYGKLRLCNSTSLLVLVLVLASTSSYEQR